MSKFEIGTVTKGKVTGIQPYGAFVALDEETQGLVHISEVKHGFVKDINEHLSVGDEVNVKVLSVDESTGKIGLSIRATEPAPEKTEASAPKKPAKKRQGQATVHTESTQGFNTLKEKLEEWIEQSNREDLIKK
ncbi:S1 domain-containing post-transcriptional regulator GSP13 [Priestia aryabhattai]|jgi:general stress protein 13|uniref:S1 domain-containing post-transcriptional regulator GSP13 n=1 Tax=Priestia megaterium TaxID=1404 RepID=UPI0039B8BB78